MINDEYYRIQVCEIGRSQLEFQFWSMKDYKRLNCYLDIEDIRKQLLKNQIETLKIVV
jgi:hypothetical protein